MPKVAIIPSERARAVPLRAGFSGTAVAAAYLDDSRAPLHLHRLDLPSGGNLRLTPAATDRLLYVWQGAVGADDWALPAGSSLVVERGAELALAGGADPATLLAFAAASPDAAGAEAAARAGGHVHLLPADRVPRNADLGGGSGVGGGMHADSRCPTCAVWLHENHFPPSVAPEGEPARRGIHSHSEDEIIFVTAGHVRLGSRLFGPGTAIAIAADTLYSLSAGPDGLSFVNFRAGEPGDIRFADGPAMNEPAYWQARLPRPEPIVLR